MPTEPPPSVMRLPELDAVTVLAFAPLPPLPQADRELIRDWIDQGALNN